MNYYSFVAGNLFFSSSQPDSNNCDRTEYDK